MADAALPTPITPAERLLTAAEFQRLADVPPEVEWFANIRNRSTRRAYENAIKDFMQFTGIVRPEEFRTATRAHVIAWRDDLNLREDIQSGATVRRQRREAAIFAATTRDQRADPRIPRGSGPPHGRQRRPPAADPQQPHGPARKGARSRYGLQAGAEVFRGDRLQDWRPRAAGD